MKANPRSWKDRYSEGEISALCKKDTSNLIYLKVVIDSGASVAALPVKYAKSYPMKSTPPRNFRTASGQPVKALGEKQPIVRMESDTHAKMSFTVMNVHRPLVVVSKIVSAGHRIVFDSEANGVNVLEDRANSSRQKLYEENGVFAMPFKSTRRRDTVLPGI